MEKHILFVEDDASIASGLIYAMEQEGYRVTHCKNVSAAFERMEDRTFDLALLDMQLSDGVGKEIAQVMKAEQVPLIYLTVVDDEDEIVGALEDGAADYITKPFRLREVLARIKKSLQGEPETAGVLKLGGVSIDTDAGKVFVRGNPVTLTALEYRRGFCGRQYADSVCQETAAKASGCASYHYGQGDWLSCGLKKKKFWNFQRGSAGR